MKGDYSITRKEAAQILSVSIRTVDRYIRSGKLSSQVVAGSVYLSRKALVKESKGFVQSKNVYQSSQVSSGVQTKVDESVVQTTEAVSINKSDDLLIKLDSHLRNQIEEKQSRIELASYQLGKIESQLRSKDELLDIENSIRILSNQNFKIAKYLKTTIILLIIIAILLLFNLQKL